MESNSFMGMTRKVAARRSEIDPEAYRDWLIKNNYLADRTPIKEKMMATERFAYPFSRSELIDRNLTQLAIEHNVDASTWK